MNDRRKTIPDFFIVYPDNEKFLSGELTFEQRSRSKMISTLAWCIVTLATGWGLYLVFGHGIDLESLLVACVLVLFLAFVAISELKLALTYRKQIHGQFVNGKILNSEAYWENRGKLGSLFALKITYSFLTPTGIQIECTVKSERPDLWKQAPERFKGIRANFRRWSHPEELQKLAPEAGTPLKVCYVDDRFFRVM